VTHRSIDCVKLAQPHSYLYLGALEDEDKIYHSNNSSIMSNSSLLSTITRLFRLLLQHLLCIASGVTLEYRYSPLSPTSIRLLRILPSGKNPKTLRCELFEYPLHDLGKSSPYDALSYCWGSVDTSKTIIVDNYSLHVTQNLYAALLHLRDHSCSRVMWIDAICINQDDNKEKEAQIPLIAGIYAKANRVVVWLGEAENDSHNALEVLRLTGDSPAELSKKNTFRQAILQLLQRPWFRRIWVRN
jgi:hypothetical protein